MEAPPTSEPPGTGRGRHRPSAPSLGGLIAAAGWTALLVSVATLLVGTVYPLSLATHFRPQMVLAVLGAASAAAVLGDRRHALALAGGASVLLALLVPTAPTPWGGDHDDARLEVLFANVNRSNGDHDALIRLLEIRAPDVVGLSEVDDAWLAALEAVSDSFPYVVLEPRDDNFGIALLSRMPLTSGEVLELGPAGLPSIRAEVVVEGEPVTVWVTHPIPPVNRFAAEMRDGQLREIGERVAREEGAVIVVGDLNDSPWSPTFREFTRAAGLQSAARGLRSLYTWPTDFPILFTRLDHCLYAGRLAERGYSVLPSIGSDHFPLTCGFDVAAGSPRPDRGG